MYRRQLQKRKQEIREQLTHLENDCRSFDVKLFRKIYWENGEDSFEIVRHKDEGGNNIWVAKRVRIKSRIKRTIWYWKKGEWVSPPPQFLREVVDMHNLHRKDPSFIISSEQELLELYVRNGFLDY
jgi:hypothetical protein